MSRIDRDEVWRLYREELLTMEEVGKRLGCSKQNIYHILRSRGEDYHVMFLVRKCKRCGGELTVNRGRLKRGGGVYCSVFCYHSDRSINGVYSRRGTRIGRKVMGASVGEVVHHINGDDFDNRVENLMVFKDSAAHASFHKSGAAKALKEKVDSGELVVVQRRRGSTPPKSAVGAGVAPT